MSDFAIAPFSAQEVIDARSVLGAIYREAFRIESDERIERFLTNSLVRHTEYPDYRCVVARDESGEIVGFVYGYRSDPGHWWHDEVAPVIRAHGHGHMLESAFEFVEFAVAQAAQGRGIGGALHDAILGQVTQRWALLSTDAGPNPAHEMYRRRGWIDLVTDMTYPGGDDPAILMGLDLARWRVPRAATP